MQQHPLTGQHNRELAAGLGYAADRLGLPAGRLTAAAGVPLFATLAERFAARWADGVVLATPNPLHAAQSGRVVDTRER